MSEPKPIYLNDTRGDYWQKVAEQERKKAADNLRLAAERASEIAELKQELELNRANLYAMGKYVIEIAELREKLKEANEDARMLAEELELEQNPGYSSAALSNHYARVKGGE